jgi:GNAT superfamily N-acetyltransferase
MTEPTVRQARQDDHAAVAAFTSETWSDRDQDDYIAAVFEDWVASDGPDQRTVVVDTGEDLGGICQVVLLTDHEAWFQGMRVNPRYRGAGFGRTMMGDLFAWARQRGATVGRAMVFSWNDAGFGITRAAGFDAGIEARWAEPDPDESATGPADYSIVDDPDAAWSCWHRSDACHRLGGLGVDPEESWALSEVTRERLHRLADDQRVIAVQDDDGTRAMAARVRTWDRHDTDESWAVYGASTWDSLDAARSLFAAIARDAATLGVDHTRVLIPETPGAVSDAAVGRAGISDDPVFVMEADLTATDPQ